MYMRIYIYKYLNAKLKVATDVWSALPAKIMIIYNVYYIYIFFLANPASTASEKKGDPKAGSTALCLSFHSFSSSLSCHHSTPWLAATNNCDRPFSGAKAATARGPFAPERWSWLP